MTPDSPEILDSSAAFLDGRQRDDFSQFGEDGLIEAILETIGVNNRWCFEVGASDGEFFSNTLRLRNDGWSAVLIEADAGRFEQLARFQNERVRCVHERIGPDSLDRILSNAGAPQDLDFGAIDVDGQDWWVFDGLELYRPRVLMVEFANAQPQSPIPALGDTAHNQAGRDAIVSLAKSKGYVPLAATQVNLICVTEESWSK